ncbi:pentapeptide repeat-containing protein [Epibacterium sp. MM17-32]|uniref:pentapeptide repeat-containing protein n=1 Tax=Epibacterium sp. MM17-32 TaxID=2917734 RepID=UPI001EF4B763|nr:pentapeptide repeat-containing protein [Epibacterium sp. MM17-32]MCG7627599.1 pentapeptide repeat-containing protein [Epibacterium sp. MM17-32]
MTDAPETPESLSPANENPWYILMTLHGEQKGEEIDWELHEKNRQSWHAWIGQYILEGPQLSAVEGSRIDINELHPSNHNKKAFERQWQNRIIGTDVGSPPDPKGRIRLENAIFSSSLHLDKFVFQSRVSFQGSVFTKGVSFENASFTQEAHLEKATFEGTVSFRSAYIRGFSYFTKTRFGIGGNKICLPDFTDCQFEKPISFRQALFRDGCPDFTGAVLHEKTSFTARLQPTSDEIAEDKDLEGQTYWPQKTKQDPVSARESCATIRHVLTQQGLPEEAHFFFRREMHFAGLPSEGRSLGARLPYLLFGWLSDFGYSIQRPLVWLLCLWAFGGAAFWGYLASCCVPAPLDVVERPMGTAMALSFSNLFPLFGFGRGTLGEILDKMPPVLQVLSGAQTVLSLPLLFFLGLALRQRFRLR